MLAPHAMPPEHPRRPGRHGRSIAAALVVLAIVGACLPAFAPRLRAREHHAGVSPRATDETCMACHPSEYELRADPGLRARAMAPIVAAWMITDRRGCVGCHIVREPRR
ncbi:MAG: hypothetical protein IPK74_09535 [Deltaproteobacteria bacterium]|nr:hypothetical protein [Deltaproteobacteria bacterium]